MSGTPFPEQSRRTYTGNTCSHEGNTPFNKSGFAISKPD